MLPPVPRCSFSGLGLPLRHQRLLPGAQKNHLGGASSGLVSPRARAASCGIHPLVGDLLLDVARHPSAPAEVVRIFCDTDFLYTTCHIRRKACVHMKGCSDAVMPRGDQMLAVGSVFSEFSDQG